MGSNALGRWELSSSAKEEDNAMKRSPMMRGGVLVRGIANLVKERIPQSH